MNHYLTKTKHIISMTYNSFIKQLINPKYFTKQPKSFISKPNLYKPLPIPALADGGVPDFKSLFTGNFEGTPVNPKTPYDSDSPVIQGPMKKEDDVMKIIKPRAYVSELHSGDKLSTASLKHVKSNFTKIKTPIKVIDSEIKIAPTSNMFPWFPTLVNRVEKDGINVTRHVPHSNNEIVKQLNLGNEHIFMYIEASGKIRVDVQSPNAAYPHSKTKKATFSMEYTPPQTHVDKDKDIIMTIPASFKYIEKRAHTFKNDDPKTQGIGAEAKYTEVHPSIALSDIAPLESKLTNKHVNKIRQERGIIEGQHKNTPVHLDLHSRRITG